MIMRLILRITLIACLSFIMFIQGCFEDLDPPSPCYNLDALSVPQEVPVSEQAYQVNLAEYQYRYLKNQALHCEVNSGTIKGGDACVEFYKTKLSINQNDVNQLYFEFPGISCVHFVEIKNKDYGYCELQSTAESECQCYFDRDCQQANERCYSNQRHLINECGDDRSCTRCLAIEDAPEIR